MAWRHHYLDACCILGPLLFKMAHNLNCFILITAIEIIKCAIQLASLDVAFCYCQLNSVWLREPSLASEGCYPFCHAHTSAAQREEVSMRGTWLIEGAEARCSVHGYSCLWMLRMPHKRLFCQHQLPLRRVMNSTECVRLFLLPTIAAFPVLIFYFPPLQIPRVNFSPIHPSHNKKHFMAFTVW